MDKKEFTETIENIYDALNEGKEIRINMAMINLGTYEFNSLCNVIDFVKPLLVEGYSVAINTVYKDIPFENDIDKFIVDVEKKKE